VISFSDWQEILFRPKDFLVTNKIQNLKSLRDSGNSLTLRKINDTGDAIAES
jgi:hypothetical protein